VGLEREIDYIVRNSQLGGPMSRGGTAVGDYNIVDINGEAVQGPEGLPKKRNKTAGMAHNPRQAKKRQLAQKKHMI